MSCTHCKTDAKHSDRTGCCAACGRLFKGLSAFDRHWTSPKPGTFACVDPQKALRGNGEPVYESVDVPGGVAWRIAAAPDPRWADS